MLQDKTELDANAYEKHIQFLRKRAKLACIFGIINMICAGICLYVGDLAGFAALSILATLNLVGSALTATIASSSERYVKSLHDDEERRKKVHDLNPHKW